MDNKGNKQWLWLAIDAKTRGIVGVYIGVYIGDRSEAGARALWQFLPPIYRQCAVCYTDFWSADAAVLPSKRHRAVGKQSGLTNRIERFNCTLRQRISRLVRKTLSFSKKLDNRHKKSSRWASKLRSLSLEHFGLILAVAHLLSQGRRSQTMPRSTARRSNQAMDGKQSGDPAKAAMAMIQVVESNNPPLRLALGEDSANGIAQKLDAMKAELEAWKSVSLSTAFENETAGATN